MLDEVSEAACFVLDGIPVSSYHGTLLALTTTPTPPTYLPIQATQPVAPTTPTAAAPDRNFVKTEDLNSIFSKFSKDIIEAIIAHLCTRNCNAPVRQTDCNFCGGPHYIRDC